MRSKAQQTVAAKIAKDGLDKSARRPLDRSAANSEKFVLVLQGGGALGAYQAGAYEGLLEAGLTPDWIAGISIGAINTAIIAGNPLEQRVAKLRSFWSLVSSGLRGAPAVPGDLGRAMFNGLSSTIATAFGIPGFYTPRMVPNWLSPPGTSGALSFYDTTPLEKTLRDHIDFDFLNTYGPRVSVGAVHVTTGNFKYFDTGEIDLTPAHIMASGALPPGFPPVVIDGEAYWDGGIVSNTPLQYVLDDVNGARQDMCIFQVDLFSAAGPMPQSLSEVTEREKDIRFSSRTRLNTDVFRAMQTLRGAAQRLYDKLPANLRDDPDARLLEEAGCDAAVTIVHLINRFNAYDLHSKDNEFSRLSVDEHWEVGLADVRRTLADPRWKNRVLPEVGVNVLDLTKKPA